MQSAQAKQKGVVGVAVPAGIAVLVSVLLFGAYQTSHTQRTVQPTLQQHDASESEIFTDIRVDSADDSGKRGEGNGTSQTTSLQVQPEEEKPIVDSGKRETITLSGGCFWCTEAYLQETPGVVDAVSGYAGGDAASADYKTVSTGKTDHREAVHVTFDPVRISLREVLDVYWKHIDPTDEGGQFADRGFQYTTAIFYHNEEQKKIADASKVALQNSGLFTKPIATKIIPYTTFFAAEEYHQDFYKKSADHYERYKKASGRAGFIEDNWAKKAALLFFEEQEKQAENVADVTSDVYIERSWTQTEIDAALAEVPQDVYHILAEEGTEPPYNNAYWDNKEEGIYVDVITGMPLFSSTHKYDSKTGWPSFYKPLDEDTLTLATDYKLGYARTEVRSQSGHLGHVFDDGPKEHGGRRYCMNSLALRFVAKADMEAKGYSEWLFLFE